MTKLEALGKVFLLSQEVPNSCEQLQYDVDVSAGVGVLIYVPRVDRMWLLYGHTGPSPENYNSKQFIISIYPVFSPRKYFKCLFLPQIM